MLTNYLFFRTNHKISAITQRLWQIHRT